MILSFLKNVMQKSYILWVKWVKKVKKVILSDLQALNLLIFFHIVVLEAENLK